MSTKTSYTYRKNAQAFTEQGRSSNAPCWLCGKHIDYDAPPNSPQAHTVDHYYPRSTHPHLIDDPANFRHAHRSCNSSRGNRTPAARLETIPPFFTYISTKPATYPQHHPLIHTHDLIHTGLWKTCA